VQFTHVRGQHQEDPLSMYLYVLCMERLGNVINKACVDGHWNHMHIPRMDREYLISSLQTMCSYLP